MNLKEYLIRADMSPIKFARLIEYTPAYIYAVIAGRRKANKRLAAVISRATQGKVTVEEILSTKARKATLKPISPYTVESETPNQAQKPPEEN